MSRRCPLITSLRELIRQIEDIFIKSSEELFINFEQRKMVYFNKNKLLGWKKDFYDSRMVRYSQLHGIAFIVTHDKFIGLNRFENKKFIQLFQLKAVVSGLFIRQKLS